MIEIRHTQNTRSSYDEIYTGTGIHYFDSFFIWICKLLDIKQGSTVLDVATGRGQMVEYARQRGARAYGIDFSFMACKLTDQRISNSAICSDGQALPFRNDFFDVVTNLGSLEHFESMEQGLQEMARVLKPDGKACLLVPNTFGLRWNVQVVWKTGDVADDGQPLQRYGTRKQWENLIQDNGLSVDRVIGFESEKVLPRSWRDLRMYLKFLRHPKQIASMLFVLPFVPTNAASMFIFICSKNTK